MGPWSTSLPTLGWNQGDTLPQPWGGKDLRDGPTATTGLLQGAIGRERHSGQQEASQPFFCWSVRCQQQTNSPHLLPWSGFSSSTCSSLFGHAHFLPQTGNGRSIWWLSWNSKPLFCLIPHCSSLLPLSFLPSLWLFYHPFSSITEFLLFQSLGRCACVEQGNRDGKVEERMGVND